VPSVRCGSDAGLPEIPDKTLEKINKFFEEEWEKYKKAVKEADISPFKEYKPLKLD